MRRIVFDVIIRYTSNQGTGKLYKLAKCIFGKIYLLGDRYFVLVVVVFIEGNGAKQLDDARLISLLYVFDQCFSDCRLFGFVAAGMHSGFQQFVFYVEVGGHGLKACAYRCADIRPIHSTVESYRDLPVRYGIGINLLYRSQGNGCAKLTMCGYLCRITHMATNLSIDPELLEKALAVSGEKTKKAAVTQALIEYIAKRELAKVKELFGQLEWDNDYDYKQDRSR